MLIKFVRANKTRVIAAGLIDAVLIFCFFIMIFNLIQPNILSKLLANINPTLCIFLGLIMYRFLTILLFDSTMGMILFKLVFLNGDQEALALKEKILASIFILFQGVDYYKKY